MFEFAFTGPIRRPVMPRPADEHKLGFRSAEARLHFQDLMEEYYDALDAFMADIARRKNQVVLGMDRAARKRAVQIVRKVARQAKEHGAAGASGGKEFLRGFLLESPGALLVAAVAVPVVLTMSNLSHKGQEHRITNVAPPIRERVSTDLVGSVHATRPVIESVRRRPTERIVVPTARREAYEPGETSGNPSGPVPFF